ncbi:MAG: hypothetical protein AAGE84_02995 [Cyanobacteria bacterium P01_G01_bin.39]
MNFYFVKKTLAAIFPEDICNFQEIQAIARTSKFNNFARIGISDKVLK